jgi:hypothetical protein
MHILEPFLPDLDLSPDHNAADIAAEFKALSIFQKKLESFLRGEMDIDSFNDFLESFGITPFEYWGIVEDNTEAVLDRGEIIEDVDLILLDLIIC